MGCQDMMKHGIFAAGVLGLWIGTAGAIDLNTDALKKMQQEGHAILEEEQGFRSFRAGNGACLAAAGKPGQAGANLVVQQCNGKANQQMWKFDHQGRLASHGGTCVGIAGNKDAAVSNVVLQNCAGNPHQKWSLDKSKRLAGNAGLCLQVNGNNVVAASCGNGGNQKWQ